MHFDYSGKLQRYLAAKGAPKAAQAVGLRLRDVNVVAPPRLRVPLGSANSVHCAVSLVLCMPLGSAWSMSHLASLDIGALDDLVVSSTR